MAHFSSEMNLAAIFELICFFIALICLVKTRGLIYNDRKKKQLEKRLQMQLAFDAEIIKTQLEVQGQTMQNIGAGLHDNIGQLLSLSSLTLNSIELADQVKARQKIEAAIDLTHRSIKEMRLLGKLLQGDQLMGVGLKEAIYHEINWLEKSGNYQVNYMFEGDMPAQNNLDKDLIIFRILQEVINNIIKHSMATQINVKLAYIGSDVQLHINDNGVGFNPDNLPEAKIGMGLPDMNKRAGIVGGKVIINSGENRGTRVSVVIPYP